MKIKLLTLALMSGIALAACSADDTDAELYADDEGIDGAAASAEEAAVHIVADRD